MSIPFHGVHVRSVAMVASLLALACSDGETPTLGSGGSASGESSTGGATAGSPGAGTPGAGSSAAGSPAAAGAMSAAGAAGMSPQAGAGGGASGAAGASGGDGSSTSGGNSAGGGTGGAAQAGSSGGGAGPANGDTPPLRPLDVKATPARHAHTFKPSEADPDVSFNDASQQAIFDNRAPKLVGKLVLPFGGAGSTAGSLGGQGEFCARRGFHVLAIAAYQDYDIVIGDADFYGDARRQVFDGVTHTTKGDFANVKMVPADGVQRRTEKALAFLEQKYPDEDWGYYLNADGSVRWSDVIFTGMSHGASNAARFAMLVRVWRAVSIAGPRDNACTSLNQGNCGGVVAKWFDEEPRTPLDRFYAITGKNDSQHLQHLFAFERIGYVGEPVAVTGAAPPYGGSHRFIAEGGHEEFCGQAAYDAACNLAFGVPPENHVGVK